MTTEEIAINEALEAHGIQAVETDLGEYILQLAGEHPAHIVAPAIEKTAQDVARLLQAVDGEPVEPVLGALTAKARRQLREVFLNADVGITGANFAVADTGSICLVTNEGNAGLVTTLPPVHIVLLGMEKVVADLDDLATCLRLLARTATGQQLTTYTTLITGPRRQGEADGPEELHVIVLDNGRSALRGTRYEEMLNCIRCGACLNVCPIYRKSGGGAYEPSTPAPWAQSSSRSSRTLRIFRTPLPCVELARRPVPSRFPCTTSCSSSAATSSTTVQRAGQNASASPFGRTCGHTRSRIGSAPRLPDSASARPRASRAPGQPGARSHGSAAATETDDSPRDISFHRRRGRFHSALRKRRRRDRRRRVTRRVRPG